MKCPNCGEQWIGVPLNTFAKYTASGVVHDVPVELRKCRTCSLVWLQYTPSNPFTHCCPPHTEEDCRDDCDGMCECC